MRRGYWSLPPEAELVHAIGDQLRAEIEVHPNPEEIDHVMIRMHVGLSVPLVVSINTLSKKNRLAGFDPRVRVGRLRGTWEVRPERTVEVWKSFSYEDLEQGANVFYEHFSRIELEALLLRHAAAARFLEVWGTPYLNRVPGIHQIHARSPSCAVKDGVRGRDGALKFIFDEGRRTELLMFKFCGQT